MIHFGKLSVCGLFMLQLAVAASAVTPVVSLDGNPETEGISPVPVSVIEGEVILVAVTAEAVKNAHSYSVKCTFDGDVVMFSGASADLAVPPVPFLESNKGKMAVFLTIPGNGTVEVAAAQSGRDPATAVSGSGVLGYLSFTAKKKGNPRIAVTEARMVDCEGNSTYTDIH